MLYRVRLFSRSPYCECLVTVDLQTAFCSDYKNIPRQPLSLHLSFCFSHPRIYVLLTRQQVSTGEAPDSYWARRPPQVRIICLLLNLMTCIYVSMLYVCRCIGTIREGNSPLNFTNANSPLLSSVWTGRARRDDVGGGLLDRGCSKGNGVYSHVTRS